MLITAFMCFLFLTVNKPQAQGELSLFPFFYLNKSTAVHPIHPLLCHNVLCYALNSRQVCCHSMTFTILFNPELSFEHQ